MKKRPTKYPGGPHIPIPGFDPGRISLLWPEPVENLWPDGERGW